MRNKKKRIVALAVAAVLTVIAVWTVWGNTALELNSLTVSSERLPKGFDGYRIAHISDLHNTQFGEDNVKLIGMIRESNPDIIAITGDLIDSRNTDIDTALRFVEKAVEIAPCYYVTGNHEARIPDYDRLREGMSALGAVILEDEAADVELNGETITVLGVDDPSFQADYLSGDSETVMKSKLERISGEENKFTVLLSHRPEMFDIYADSGADLVLSGHAHGGQFRLPFLGGLIAPNQGLFPEYDSGLYVRSNTNMVVSRGIGNSIVPLRFNNRPEVILIELKNANN